MPQRTLSRTAREFLRVSVDGSGNERSHAEQHTDNVASGKVHNFTLLGAAYRETGSASRYANRTRDDFLKLLKDLETNAFRAEILVLWENSRGSRQVGEWDQLIKVCEAREVLIFITTHGRFYDPGNPRDRRSLLEDAIDSAYESDKTSMRAKRARAADAKAGKPNGVVNYGYTRRYDPVTRRFDKQVPEPEEAKVIKELFDRLYKGHTLRSIAVDFEKRGILSRQRYKMVDGKRVALPRVHFSAQHLRAMATTRAYCGEREHTPGKVGDRRPTDKTVYAKAVWPALVTKKKFLAVQAILSDPKRVTIRPGRGKHLLSMIVKCDICTGPIAALHPGTPDASYTCVKGGHIKVPYAELNDLVEEEVLTYLARPDNVAAVARAASDDENEALTAVREELAEIKDELDNLTKRVVKGELSVDFAAAVEPGLIARRNAAQTREAELSAPDELGRLLDGYRDDVIKFWRSAPMDVKRQIMRLVLSPKRLGELRITRSTVSHRRVPVEHRVVWRRGE